MLAYSPLFTPSNGSETWCNAFDDPSIYYTHHHSSFDDLLMIPPPTSPLFSPPLPTPLDDGQTSPAVVSSGAAPVEKEEEMKDPKKKKQDHNTNERNRRIRINRLYSSLRSLLPDTDQMKKLSIPATIGRAVKYIPELQNEVQELIQTKEKLLPIPTSVCPSQPNNNIDKMAISSSSSSTASTSVKAIQLGNGEISIQISSHKSNTIVVPISEILRALEEEHGVAVVDVSSTESSAGRVFHRIHLLVEASHEMKCELLREKVLGLCHRWENLYSLWMN